MEGSDELDKVAGMTSNGTDAEAGADPSVPARRELAASGMALFGAATLDWCMDVDGAATEGALLGMSVLDSYGDGDGTIAGSEELVTASFGIEVDTGDRDGSVFEVAETIGTTELAIATGDSNVDVDGAATETKMLGLGDGLARLVLDTERTCGKKNEDEAS